MTNYSIKHRKINKKYLKLDWTIKTGFILLIALTLVFGTNSITDNEPSEEGGKIYWMFTRDDTIVMEF